MSSASTPEPTQPADTGVDGETVITGRVVDDSGQTVGGAVVRLLDDSHEFAAGLIASASGNFRFFAAPGTWTVRAQSNSGQGDITIAPTGAGVHQIDIKVA